MEIGATLRALPTARVLACTATATPVVRDEIVDRLGLPPGTPQMVRGFARPNLSLRAIEVDSARERRFHTDAALGEALGGPGAGRGTAIVYAPTRKATEAEADRLAGEGWAAGAYHAGLPGATRDATQGAFLAGRTEVVVATNAFGMGIDRPDVRAVVHLAPPGSVEAYYQEVGRAGRDGADALGLLLVSPQDLPLRRRLIERDHEGRRPQPGIVEHKWSLFLELMRWSEGGSCRHDAILRYFGDEEETLAGCGRCDVCRSLDEAPADEAEVTVQVQKALCGVARVSGRFGIQVAVKLLRGVEDDRLGWSGLRETKTFGTMSDRTERWITRLLRRCVTAGWVDFTGEERPVVVLTGEGREVIHGRRPARLLLPPLDDGRAVMTSRRRPPSGGGAVGGPGTGRAREGRAGGDSDLELDPRALQLFEALRSFRLETARGENVPPYVVASDRTLREIARCRPTTPETLLLIHGIGPAKVERYGDGLLAVVRASGAAEGSSPPSPGTGPARATT
jgi:ATP-dependent DNA helicase RecQ